MEPDRTPRPGWPEPIITAGLSTGGLSPALSSASSAGSASMSRRQSWKMHTSPASANVSPAGGLGNHVQEDGGLGVGLGIGGSSGQHLRSQSTGSSTSVQLSPSRRTAASPRTGSSLPAINDSDPSHTYNPLMYSNPFDDDESRQDSSTRPFYNRFNSSDASVNTMFPTRSGSGSDQDRPMLSESQDHTPRWNDVKGKSPEKINPSRGAGANGTLERSGSQQAGIFGLMSSARDFGSHSIHSSRAGDIGEYPMDDAFGRRPSFLSTAPSVTSPFQGSSPSFHRSPSSAQGRDIIVSDITNADKPDLSAQGILRRGTTLRFRKAAGTILGRVGRRVINVDGDERNGAGDEVRLRLRDERDVDSVADSDSGDSDDPDRIEAMVRSPGVVDSDEKNPFDDTGKEGMRDRVRVSHDGLEMDTLPTLRSGIAAEKRRTISGSGADRPLQGKSMWMFGPRHPLRLFCFRMLSNSYAEPVILLLIILNAVILVVQSSTPIYEPRNTDGYFKGWEDWVLLGVFILYTLEIFARVVVSGFLFDAQPSEADRRDVHGVTTAAPPSQTDVLIARMQTISTRFLKPRSSHDSGGRSLQTSRSAGSRSPSPTGRSATQMREELHQAQAWRSANKTRERGHRRKKTLGSLSGQGHLSVGFELPYERGAERQKSILNSSRPYLRHSWHRVDLVAVIAFWISFLLAMFHLESRPSLQLFIFRALSTLRLSRLLLITGGTATILRSLKSAGPLLVRIGFFTAFALLLFAILGVTSFNGSLRRSCQLDDPFNSTQTISLGNQCGGSINSVTLEEVGFSYSAPKGYICPVGTVCSIAENPDGQSWDNVFAAAVQVVVIASSNGWSPLMYALMDSDYYASCLFAIAVLLVLNFWLFNLLVAVVMTTFANVRSKEYGRSAFGADAGRTVAPSGGAQREPGRVVIIARKALHHGRWIPILCIIASVVVAGIRRSDSSDTEKQIILLNERVATALLDVDIALRMLCSLSVGSFFNNSLNTLDLCLAISSTIIVVPGVAGTTAAHWLAFFAVARWYRVVLAVPLTRDFLRTCFGNARGITNMLMVLLLANFLSALLATQMLRGDLSDDNLMNFADVWNSFAATLQVLSSENWTDVLYSTMSASGTFQQVVFTTLLFVLWFVCGFVILMNLLVAAISENFHWNDEKKLAHQRELWLSRDQPFILHSSIFEKYNPYRWVKPVPHSGRGFSEPMRDHEDQHTSRVSQAPLRSSWIHRLAHSTRRQRAQMPTFEETADDTQIGLQELLRRNPGMRPDLAVEAASVRRRVLTSFCQDHPTYDTSLWLFSSDSKIRRACQALVPSSFDDRIFGRRPNRIASLLFKWLIQITVLASLVIAAYASPIYRQQYYALHGLVRMTNFDEVEMAVVFFFAIEAVVKTIADGFLFAPNAYLRSPWNMIDLIVLVCLATNTGTSLAVLGGVSRFTRALTAARAFRLITGTRLRDTAYKVFWSGAKDLSKAMLLVILYIIPWAVWGLTLFAGRLNRCNDEDAGGASSCTNEYLATPIDDSMGFLVPRVWDNPSSDGSHWNFDTFPNALLILVEIMSLEGWIDVSQSLSSIVGIDQNIELNHSPFNAVFAMTYILLGSGLILAVFLAIIIVSFTRRSGTALLTAAQQQRRDLFVFLKRQRPTRMPPAWNSSIRQWCARRAADKEGWWTRLSVVLFLVHFFLLTLLDYSNNIVSGNNLNWAFAGLTGCYVIDLMVGFAGLGWRAFLRDKWNVFYMSGVIGILGTTIPALVAFYGDTHANPAILQLQKLFLIIIPFNLVRRIDSLNVLFKTSVTSLPALLKLLGLWGVLFFFYALVGMEVFGLTKVGNDSFSRFTNFRSFGNSLLLLGVCSTGEGWNGFMHDYARAVYPFCTESDNYLLSDCGSTPWAYGFFISWNILSMYIMVNTFTAIVVESFAYVYEGAGQTRLSRKDIRAFKAVWSSFDPHGTGYISRYELVPFLRKMQKPFDVRLHSSDASLVNLLHSSRPPRDGSGQGDIIAGKVETIDLDHFMVAIGRIDRTEQRRRRILFNQIYLEARQDEVPSRGCSFERVILLLAAHTLFNDEQSMELEDLAVRKEKLARIQDIADLERVKSVFRGMCARREYRRMRGESRRTLEPEHEGVPAIVLNPADGIPDSLGDEGGLLRRSETQSEDSHDDRGYETDAQSGAPLWRRASVSISERRSDGGLGERDSDRDQN